MSEPFSVARLDELESFPGPGSLRWTPVRRPFGITAFGVNAYTATEAGQDVVEKHTEATLGHEELYVVVAGRAAFTLGGEKVDAPAGTAVFIRDPGTEREAQAVEPGTTVLAVGGKPGLHEPSAWEWMFAAYGYAEAGEPERGIEELEAGLAVRPEREARFRYDLACLECRAGRLDDALVDARRAFELEPKLRELAEDDRDLDPIRERLAD